MRLRGHNITNLYIADKNDNNLYEIFLSVFLGT